jgi:manganese efflux pump family protein
MSLISLIGLSVGLAMDATAVAIATSIMLGRVNRRQIFRFTFHFGLFQAAMPVVGWFAGRGLREYIESWDHWVAFTLLGIIGGKAIVDTFRDSDQNDKTATDPTRGSSLVLLSVATSIDALAVGLSLAALQVDIWYPAAMIGVITAAMTLAGMLLGARLGRRFGKRVRLFGGVLLIGIGIKILVEHTLL